MPSTLGFPAAAFLSDPSAGGETRWAWECPGCGESYGADVELCAEDGTPLRKVGFSLPFIWIG
jgi:hypothetical protein